MNQHSLNALANQRQLEPWASWTHEERPRGYVKAMDETAAIFFADNGFLVLEDALSPPEVAALNAETAQICRGARGEIRGLTPTTANESDLEVMRRYLCIHFPHKISELARDTLAHPKLLEVLTHVIGTDVKCMQSMLFVKASGKPGQAWHQDEFFIPTRDRSLTGAWIALDDATVENGCLWVIPGSHQHGVLWPQRAHNDTRFDCAGEAMAHPYSDDDAVPVEVKKGSVVFFNGYLLHRSLPNHAASGFRRSLVNHYMSASSLLPWYGFAPDQSWATADYRDIVLVAGRDPYGWKGVQEIATAHVRPSGAGGCGNTDNNEAEDDDHDH
jgi:phytanoyl-CoA hydroxylase